MGGRETSKSSHGNHRRDLEEGATRPQQGGEAETTRFGMEDGDNTDIPATGEGSQVDPNTHR